MTDYKQAKQITNHILMLRPSNFGFNEQTAASNAFQTQSYELSKREIRSRAVDEFDAFVGKLRTNGIHVLVVQDTEDPIKPDAVFPNNWVSFHQNGTILTYPMEAPIRRLERRQDVLDKVGEQFEINAVFGLEKFEEQNKFLEGTGSMILDRVNKIAYACLSTRTDEELLGHFCKINSYKKVVFEALDQSNKQIYHTNVMMALGTSFAVICLDSIKDVNERTIVEHQMRITNKEIIAISLDQVNSFAGNMLQVSNEKGENFLVMSKQAFNSLNESQLNQIKSHTQILFSDISTIEKHGGGSVRCMMAEIFLPEK